MTKKKSAKSAKKIPAKALNGRTVGSPAGPANGIKITSVKSVKIYSREARLSAKINHPQIFLVLFCGFFPCNFAAVIIDNDAKCSFPSVVEDDSHLSLTFKTGKYSTTE